MNHRTQGVTGASRVVAEHGHSKAHGHGHAYGHGDQGDNSQCQGEGVEQQRTPFVQGVERGEQSFALPPIADAGGYTFLFESGPDQFDRIRKLTLDLKPATFANLGEQL